MQTAPEMSSSTMPLCQITLKVETQAWKTIQLKKKKKVENYYDEME